MTRSWDDPVKTGTTQQTRDNLPKLGQPTHAGRPTGHWDGPLGVGQLASKWDDPQLGTPQPNWDTPAKMGQPSQTGTAHPCGTSHIAWDVSTAWGVP